MIKKCLEHTSKNVTIITAIWKVFSILLEYCCHTDYNMLITKIQNEFEEEKQKLEDRYKKKFQEQADNEKDLKDQLERLQKHCEAVEKDMMNERTMRLKIEEEHNQNTKNHEEEVQLRLKFEAKLNNMHSAHRDLETKYRRTKQDLTQALEEKEQLQNKVNAKIDEITELKSRGADSDSKLTHARERIDAMNRDIKYKAD